jgi:predicted DCC family thiol-disulfide oxidoreductase YuxK
MPAASKIEIFTDGACPLCRWTRARIEPFDTDARLRFRDYNDPAVAALAPYSREELAREMHVRTPDGRWYAGYEAWLVVLKAMPLLEWLGRLLSTSAFRKLGPRLYRWVARNRYRFGAPRECARGAGRPQDG